MGEVRYTDVKSPHSLEAERALLGCIILDNDAIDVALKIVAREDFFSEANRMAFAQMVRLRQAEHVIDLVTLSDELGKLEQLEKVGGASYLASLTDGVPVGNYSAVNEYARIVKEKSTLRRMITSANNVIARAFEGIDDPAQLLSLAMAEFAELAPESSANGNGQATLEIVEAPTKPETPHVEHDWTLCPKAPDSAWYGDSRSYRALIGPVTEPSDNFHLACFLTLMSAAVGRSPFMMIPDVTYPNLYTTIVGPSCWAAKGVATRAVMRLLNVSPLVTRIPNLGSAEGALRRMQPDFNNNPSLKKGGVLFVFNELNEVLRKGSQKGSIIIPFLKNNYDWQPSWELNTGMSPVRIQDPPTLNVLAASEIDDLDDIDPRDLRGGFANRFMWVPGDPKAPDSRSQIPEKGLWIPLLDRLQKRIEMWNDLGPTLLTWSGEAQELWDTFYSTIRERGSDDPKVASLAARQRAIVPRIALLWAALNGEREHIQTEQLQAAIAFADFQLQGLYYIFRGVGQKPWVKEENEIIDFVRRKAGVPMRQLRWRFIGSLGNETFERRMKSLVCDALHTDRPLKIQQRPGKRGKMVNWVILTSST